MDLANSTAASIITKRRLEGKVALILSGGGASGGIGASTTRVFSENGATVVIAGVQADSNVSLVRCDVSDEEQVRAAVDEVVAHHGKLDVVVVNLEGVGGGWSIVDDTVESLSGAFYGGKHAARVMMPTKKGCILFTAAGAACNSRDFFMIKYGIVGLVRNLSAELAPHGIRVNCISADTGVDDAGSVAKAALYLASDDANYVNGHNLVLNATEDEICVLTT